jgi:tellurite resistance protein TehA-like permease
MKLKIIILSVIGLGVILWLTGFKINWKIMLGIIVVISAIVYLLKNLFVLYNRAIFYEHK